MMNDLMLPVPVLMINHRAKVPEVQLQKVLVKLGYPQELIFYCIALDDARHLISEHLPNLIFYAVEDKTDLEFIPAIKALYPSTHLVTFHAAEHTALIYQALCLGADAYLLQNEQPESVYIQLRSILRGGAALHPAFAQYLLQEKFNTRRENINTDNSYEIKQQPMLSAPEYQILQHSSESENMMQIAQELQLSAYQVDSFIKSIFKKLALNIKI